MVSSNTNKYYQLIFSKLLSHYNNISSWLLYGGDLDSINGVVDKFVVEILHNSNEDLLWINDMRIDQIRRIKGFLQTTAARNGYKVVVAGDIASMNDNSANALLKILEEPIGKSIIILISSSLYKVLDTIRSRCCKLYFPDDNVVLSSGEISLYQKILQNKKVELSACNDIQALLKVVQFLICRLITVKLNVTLTPELFSAEKSMLQGIRIDIEDLYSCWEKTLNINQAKDKCYLLEEHINILFCNTIRV